MNKLSLDKRVQILSMLVEGSSMRSISRVAQVSINSVTKLLVDAGNACEAYHDAHVRDVKASRIQCDEIWSFLLRQGEAYGNSEAPRPSLWRRVDLDRYRCRLQVDRFLAGRWSR